MFDRRVSDGEHTVGVLLALGELMGAAGVEASDDHGVAYVVVQAAKAEVREGAKAGGPQVGGMWSWRAAVMSWVRPGRAADIQIRRPFSSVRARKRRP